VFTIPKSSDKLNDSSKFKIKLPPIIAFDVLLRASVDAYRDEAVFISIYFGK
jgi:hypothetical protein